MSALPLAKRKRPGQTGRPKFTKRKRLNPEDYHSSSEEEDQPVAQDQAETEDIADHDTNDDDNENGNSDDDATSDDDEQADSDIDSNTSTKKAKRNDPEAFATSISKILSSKLTSTKRADPVLSRSKNASQAAKELSENRLEARAKRKLRDDKRNARERGREKDVLGIESGEAAEAAELEKRLKKTAQRGVVKLFNAVRAAQVKAEETEIHTRGQGTIGVDRRKAKVNEMSKKGFLDLLVEGGKA